VRHRPCTGGETGENLETTVPIGLGPWKNWYSPHVPANRVQPGRVDVIRETEVGVTPVAPAGPQACPAWVWSTEARALRLRSHRLCRDALHGNRVVAGREEVRVRPDADVDDGMLRAVPARRVAPAAPLTGAVLAVADPAG
jgi:hypothetical protein